MSANKEISFESALAKLEKSVDEIKKEGTTLEAALQLFDDGLKQYEYCSELLSKAKQKVMLYDKSTAKLKELD
jgi:exodeoxyribonuclease VII small subunit